MKPWRRRAGLEQQAETSLVSISWWANLQRATFWHAVTDVVNEDDTSYQMRMVCHALVDALPDEALDELLEAVTSMKEFYLNRPVEPSLLPAPSLVIPATVTRAVERPEFYVVEE